MTMTIPRIATILFLGAAIFACANVKQQTGAKIFSASVIHIKGDTIIGSAVYYEGYILCMQDDGRLFVLDTAFNYVDSLTAKFSFLKIQFLLPYNDTITLVTDKDILFLDTAFTFTKYSHNPFKYIPPDYVDSTYYVYSCSAGEWGGAVFFLDKKTGKTYSYPATDVQQVFKVNDTYVVSSFLAHMSGFSDYLFIKDPTRLYEIKDEKQKTFCNWYMQPNNVGNPKLFDTATPPGVTYYSDTFVTRTLLTFPYKNEVYSIYCTDSATILAKFQHLKLIPIDTLLHRQILFHSAKTHLIPGTTVTAFNASWGVAGAGDALINYQNTGLIFIHNNKITFVEFQTPHMSAGYP